MPLSFGKELENPLFLVSPLLLGLVTVLLQLGLLLIGPALLNLLDALQVPARHPRPLPGNRLGSGQGLALGHNLGRGRQGLEQLLRRGLLRRGEGDAVAVVDERLLLPDEPDALLVEQAHRVKVLARRHWLELLQRGILRRNPRPLRAVKVDPHLLHGSLGLHALGIVVEACHPRVVRVKGNEASAHGKLGALEPLGLFVRAELLILVGVRDDGQKSGRVAGEVEAALLLQARVDLREPLLNDLEPRGLVGGAVEEPVEVGRGLDVGHRRSFGCSGSVAESIG